MREAIDTLLELETRRVDEAREAHRIAEAAFEDAEAVLALAEQRVLAHDEARRQEGLRALAEAISPSELARDDAFRRAMRAERVELVERVERAADAREQCAGVREQTRLVLAESRARARAIEARIEARTATHRKSAEKRAEDDADEHRRR